MFDYRKCKRCNKWRFMANDGDFYICSGCELPCLTDEEMAYFERIENETRLSGSEGRVW